MQQKSTRGVQQEEVFAAADALLAEKVRPTIERVRLKVGRGSPNTVAPMLETWFAGLGVRLGVTPDKDGQGGPPASVRDAMDSVWATALREGREQAHAALSDDRRSLAAMREQLAREREVLLREQAAAAARVAGLEAALDDSRRQVDERSEFAATLVTQVAGLQSELAASRGSVGRLVDEREADSRRFSEQLAGHADERRRLEERANAAERRLLSELDRARQESKQLALRAEQAQTGRETDRETAARAYGGLVHRHRAVELQLTASSERLAAAEQREADLRAQLSEQKAALAASLAYKGSPQQPDKGAARKRLPTAAKATSPRASRRSRGSR